VRGERRTDRLVSAGNGVPDAIVPAPATPLFGKTISGEKPNEIKETGSEAAYPRSDASSAIPEPPRRHLAFRYQFGETISGDNSNEFKGD
jgi:hypothetical protein